MDRKVLLALLVLVVAGIAFTSLYGYTYTPVKTITKSAVGDWQVKNLGYLPAVGAFVGTVESEGNPYVLFMTDNTLRIGKYCGLNDVVLARTYTCESNTYIAVVGRYYGRSVFFGAFTSSFVPQSCPSYSPDLYAAAYDPYDTNVLYALGWDYEESKAYIYRGVFSCGDVTVVSRSFSVGIGSGIDALAVTKDKVIWFKNNSNTFYAYELNKDAFQTAPLSGPYTGPHIDAIPSGSNPFYAYPDGNDVVLFYATDNGIYMFKYFPATHTFSSPRLISVPSVVAAYFDGNYVYGFSNNGSVTVFDPETNTMSTLSPLSCAAPFSAITLTDSPFPSYGCTTAKSTSSTFEGIAFTVSQAYPELYPTVTVPSSITANTEFNVTVTVHNAGNADANAPVLLAVGSISREFNVFVPAGSAVDVNVPITLPAGDYNLVVTVDPDNVIPELDETDNTVSLSIHVSAPTQPAPSPPPSGGIVSVSPPSAPTSQQPEQNIAPPSMPIQPATPTPSPRVPAWLVLLAILLIVAAIFFFK